MAPQMHFGLPIPWWGAAAAVAAAASLAWWAYARPPVALSARRRSMLIAFRFAVLLVLTGLLLRPVATQPAPPGGLVAVLIDQSRSMAIVDEAGVPRIERARVAVRDSLEPALAETPFRIETVDLDHSDIAGALHAAAERIDGREVAGVVFLTDGVDVGTGDPAAAAAGMGVPVHLIGVGEAEPGPDVEVAGLTAGEAWAAGSLVDLTSTLVAHGGGAGSGSGTTRAEVRLLANGRLVETRPVAAAGDGAAVVETFRVSPDPDLPTVFTVAAAGNGEDLVPGNNRRSVLVPPAGRPRRILMIEGAPGYEHSFLKRAWQADAAIVVDAVIRKGQNDRGELTFYVQGDPARAAPLAAGYPQTRAELFAYDAVVFGNIEAEFFRPEQLDLTAAFVAERGGGLLLLGPATLQGGTYASSTLESVLPAALADRLGLSADGGRLIPTAAGLAHPMLRLAETPEATRDRWGAAPPLAGTIRLGEVRPGAAVLAVAPPAPGERDARPLIVAQRYGAGRSMIFAGRGAWRWRMGLPNEDRMYETWWGQAARWLTAAARDPVDVSARVTGSAGVQVRVDVRDEEYRPAANADVTVVVTDPAGAETVVRAPPVADEPGRYAAEVTGGTLAGVYRVDAAVTRAGREVVEETSRAWVLARGADPELADPWLRRSRLERIAAAGGGAYLDAAAIDLLPARLQAAAPPPARPVTRQIWHHPLMFLLIVVLLGSEWTLRRFWGMR